MKQSDVLRFAAQLPCGGKCLRNRHMFVTRLLTARHLLKITLDLEFTVWTGLERVHPVDVFACLTKQVLLFFLATESSCWSYATL